MPNNLNLGANIPLVADWAGTNIFTDLMKQSRGLSSYEDPAEVPATIGLDANGYPTEPFGWVIKAPLRADDHGEYQLKFKGKARVSALPALIRVEQRSEGDWQIAVVTIPVEALQTQQNYKEPILMLRFTDLQGESVREISLVKKSWIQTDGSYPTFHPDWIAHLRRFNTIRFMPWMTERHAPIDWADRPGKDRLTQATEGGVRGVAAEYIVELAQLIGCDIWINIPVLATDDYVRGFADFLTTNLPATVKVYTEYGNELWAGTWEGWANENAATAEILAGNPELNYDQRSLSNNYDVAILAMRRYARRTKQIGDIFKTQFELKRVGDASRIRPVYCYQSVNPELTLKMGLDFLEHQYSSVASAIWGISPKTGVDEGSITTSIDEITVEDIVGNLRKSLSRIIGGYQGEDNVTPVLEQAAALAAWYNIAYAGYEGGIGLAQPRKLRASVVFDMMTRKREDGGEIYNICAEYLQSWFSYGNDNLLCWFLAGASDWKGANIFGESDICGLTWSINEQNTEPIRALDAALARGSYERTAGLAVPGLIDLRRHTARRADWERLLRNTPYWQSNDQLYLINANAAKSYSFVLVSERNVDFNTHTDIWINNKKITTIMIPMGVGSHTSAAFKTALRKGMNTLKMIYSNGSMGNYHLIVKEPTIAVAAIQKKTSL